MKRTVVNRFALCLSVVLASALALPAAAQSQPRPKPKDLEKIDDIPPPPNVLVEPRQQRDAKTEPTVTVVVKDGEKHEEYRVRGKLYKVRVVSSKGEYWLVDSKGDGNMARLDSGVVPHNSVPMWVLLEW
jgi:hypothetical protein